MISTYIGDALDRVEAERDHLDAKRAALERFEAGVQEIPTVTPGQPSGTHVTDGGFSPVSQATGTDADRCREVRTLFAETVQPYSADDVAGEESLLETMREEFGEDVALALAPTTGTPFTEPVQQAVLSAARQCRTEAETLSRALDAERASLREANREVTKITSWVASADETPLLDLDFEALRERHETLERHRETCRARLRARQDHLHGTTSVGGTVGLTHHSVAEYLYGPLPSTYPVLSTVLRLLDCCRECQAAVREHLVRRV